MAIGGNWDRGRAGPMARLGSIDRRAFVKASSAGALGLIFGAGPSADRARAAPAFRDYPFKLGVASGDPGPRGVMLWTRLAPEPLAPDGAGGMPPQSVAVRWEVATDEGFRRIVSRGADTARPGLGHSLHAEVRGLEPGRPYFYRFKTGSDISPVGRTKTTPLPGATTPRLSFAFASCQQYEHGYYDAYRHMAEEDLDLVLHLGDYIYERGPNEYEAIGGNVRRHNSAEVTTLAGYRNRHALYRRDPDLRAAHAAFPWVVTWDDHEVENNYADVVDQAGGSPEAFLRRRAAAYQAYYEHMPLRRSSVPGAPDMRLYRRIPYGDLAELNMLDTRQHRANQANGDGLKAPSDFSRDVTRTLLGGDQERWLLSGLADSRARWNVLAQQVYFARLDLDPGAGRLLNMDAWDGYPAARKRILDFVESRRVKNPVVLTGDVHAHWANDIPRDFDRPDSAVIATELVGSSISSGGDGSEARSDTLAILAENPQLRFFNNQRGYVRCTVTPSEWRADFRVLGYVRRPGAPIDTRAAFVVEAGDPGLHRVDRGRVSARTRVSTEAEADRLEAQAAAKR